MTAPSEPILLRHDDAGVVRLTLNRPEAYNSLSSELLGRLADELDRIAEDRHARVVVLAGAGKAFCAGHDLKEMGADLRDAPVRALFERCSRVMLRLDPPAAAGGRARPRHRHRRRLPAGRRLRPRRCAADAGSPPRA